MESYIEKLPKLVDVEIVTLTQTIIVNGQEQYIQQPQAQVFCPRCHHKLLHFNEPMTLIIAKQELTNRAEEFYNLFRYCPQCGQKLMYERPIVYVQE